MYNYQQPPFQGVNYGQSNRSTINPGYVQVPQAQQQQSPFASLLGLASAITSFIPGAQAASPFLGLASSAFGGDTQGAIQQAQQIANPQQQQTDIGQGASGGGQIGMDNAAEKTSMSEGAKIGKEVAVPNPLASPEEIQQYLTELFRRDPKGAMEYILSGMPGLGFDTLKGR